MNANKLFSEFSLKKIWDKLLQHDKAMSSTLLILSSENWVEQEDGTFKNIVSYATFKENDKLNVDLYDDGTLTETQLNEYEQYIDGFEIINGALVATANIKPTQTMTVVVKGDFEVDAVVGDVSKIVEELNTITKAMKDLEEKVGGGSNLQLEVMTRSNFDSLENKSRKTLYVVVDAEEV